MGTDPEECREHAERCRQLALDAATAEAREAYLEAARAWDQLAAEIAGAQAFIETMAEIVGQGEPESPAEPQGAAKPEAA
jgi:hypothetical protein